MFGFKISKAEAKNIMNVLPRERVHYSLQYAQFVKNFRGNPMETDDEGGRTLIATDGRIAAFFRDMEFDEDDLKDKEIPETYMFEGATIEAAKKLATKFPAEIVGNEKFQYVRTGEGQEVKIPKSDGGTYPDVARVVPKRPKNFIRLGINPSYLLKAAKACNDNCIDEGGIEIIIDLEDVVKEVKEKYKGEFDAVEGIDVSPETALIVQYPGHTKSWAIVMPCIKH